MPTLRDVQQRIVGVKDPATRRAMEALFETVFGDSAADGLSPSGSQDSHVALLNSTRTALIHMTTGDDIPVGGLPCEVYGASPQMTADVNTVAIQAALNVGGLVTLLTPGTFEVNDTLVMYDNTHLMLGPKTVLKRADGTNLKLIRNEHYSSTVVTCTNGITTTVSGSPVAGYAIATADFGANEHGFTSTNQHALFKGDTNGNFQGIFKLYEITSPTVVKFLMATGPVAALGSSAGTITAAKANANIFISGGEIDGNGANNSAAASPDFHGVILNKVLNAQVWGQTCRNFDKYAYTFCNAVNTNIHHIHAQTPSDCVHFCGPCWTSVVKDVRGMSGDDMVAFTTDNAGGFESYDLPDGNGSFYGIEVDTIRTQGSTINRMVLLAATGGFRIRGARVSNLYADSQAHCGVMLEGQPGNTGYWDDVVIDGIRGDICQSQNAVYVDADGTKNIGSLTIRNIYPKDPILANCVAITGDAAGGTTIKNLTIENVMAPALSRVDAINITGSTVTVDRGVVNNCHLDLDQANAANNKGVLYIQGATTPYMHINGCSVRGSGATTRTGFVLYLNGTSANAIFALHDCDHYNNSQLFNVQAGTTPKIIVRGGISAGICVAVPSVSFDIDIEGTHVKSGTNNKVLAFYGAGTTHGLRYHNVTKYAGCAAMGYGLSGTNTFNVTACDGTFDPKTDTAGTVFNFSAGCVWNDTRTTNPGVYVKGPTAEARLAA